MFFLGDISNRNTAMLKIRYVLKAGAIMALVLMTGCGGGGGGSASCGGPEKLGCEAGQYCSYFENLCGEVNPTGSCQPVQDCAAIPVSSVCSCDKITFFNECYADQAGHSIAAPGDCAL